MSVICGVESVVVLGCLRWAWKRCTYIGSDDSAAWPVAAADEFDAVPRACRLILAVYEPDLRQPLYAPIGGYGLNPDWVFKRVAYEQTLGHAPPYFIYVDHDNKEIVLAIRGLNLAKESDYKVLMDNKLGMQTFDGGYVHHGLLKSAIWVLNAESETLKRLWEENRREYKMVFVGHSLGSGVAALLSMIVANHGDQLGGIPRSLVRCYAVAPTRCMSLNLAVKYADVIHSVVLQDDFLPRTPNPLWEDAFKSICCLPCLLFLVCVRDTFVPEGKKLRDPRRLYAPGRIYHIVERKFCRCGTFPPEVRTAIPVEGRFEHVVLSCNATSDHTIISIEKEAEKALQILKENEVNRRETMTTPPKVQKLDRKLTLEKEHKDALELAFSLNIPHAEASKEETESSSNIQENLTAGQKDKQPPSNDELGKKRSHCENTKTNWSDVVEKLLKRSESRQLLLNR